MTRIESNSLSSLYAPNEQQLAAELGGDANAQVAAMMFMLSKEQKADASEQRDTTEARIRESQAEQVDEMREQADLMRVQAVSNMFFGMTSAALQIGAGGAGLAGQGGFSDIAKGHSQMYDTIGEFGDSMFESVIKDSEADATAAQHEADASIRELEEVNDNADDARDLKNTVLDFMRSIQEQKAEAAKMTTNWVKA
jgi:hypothetical protein